MVWNTSAFQLLIISATGGFTGLFVYSPIPGAGNLIASIAAQAGTDPYGNAYRAGVTSYLPGVSFSELTAGAVVLGLSGGSPSVIQAEMSVATLGAGQSLEFNSGTIGADVPSQMFLNDSAAVTGAFRSGLQVIDALDGQTYNTEHIRLQATGASQLVNSVSDAPVTGLTRHVGIGKYHFRAKVQWTQGGVASNQQFGFTGPAVSSSSETVVTVTTNSQNVVDARHNSGLATVAVGSAAYGVNDVLITEIDGMATFTAAGTLSVGVACTNAANTFTVNSPVCWLEVDPM